MNENIRKRNELLAGKVIKGLASRNMTGYYAADKEEARSIALGLIAEGSTVTMGGGMSVHEIGLVEALKKGEYNFIDRDEIEDKRAAFVVEISDQLCVLFSDTFTDDSSTTDNLVVIQLDIVHSEPSLIKSYTALLFSISGLLPIRSES